MANYEKAYPELLKREGGYKLTNRKNDRGGQTYAGISRKHWPEWPGWDAIDKGLIPKTELVRSFYYDNFWLPLHGDEIHDQRVAFSLVSFGVNAGIPVAVKLAQIVAGVEPDGAIGPKTLHALNTILPGLFHPAFAIAKIARYRDIVRRDPTQMENFLGWVNRTLEDL